MPHVDFASPFELLQVTLRISWKY